MRKQRIQTPISHTFFNSIDTPQKAYVLGFFVADGSIVNEQARNPHSLYFTSKDFSHLGTIKRLMGSEHNIHKHGANCFVLPIGSKTLTTAIRDLGYTNRKSYEAHLPVIQSLLMPHFVRGLFDGDGSITRGFRAKDGIPYVTIYLDGTHRLLTEVSKWLPATSPLKHHKTNLWRLTLAMKKAFAVLDWMYEDSEGMRLERKHQRYLDAKARKGFYASDFRVLA